MDKRFRFTGVSGLPLARRAASALNDAGIYVRPTVTIEHQHLAHRYVIRGMESGGAVQALGRYVTFADDHGERIPYLHLVEVIGVNGLHAIVIAPVLVRLDLLRKGRTYELLITRHACGTADAGKRPALETKVLFRGVHGRLELDLCGESEAQRGSVLPVFHSLAGEPKPIPKRFVSAVKAATVAVNCRGCEHSHYLIDPRRNGSRNVSVKLAPESAASEPILEAANAETLAR